MGALRGSSQKTTVTEYSGLQVQSTSSSVPIPIIYGRNISSPNVFWYNGFVAIPQNTGKGGKGGGSSSKTTSWDYHCDIMMGVCEGPINGIGYCWTTSTVPVELIGLGLALVPGATPGAVVPWMEAKYPTQYLTYPGVAYVVGAYYDLGTSASVGSNNFEVFGVLYNSGFNGIGDADPAQVIYDFLTNSQYGVGFPAASIDATTLYANAGDTSYQTYCWANGLAISPVLNAQETASSILDRWLKLTNSTAVWSGGKLKFMPFGDSGVTAYGKTFTPNLTALYALTDEDFLHSEGEDPVKVLRADPYSLPNQQSIEIQCRNDAYNTGPVTAFDQSAINRFGLRVGSTITAHEICDVNIAQVSAQLNLQRELYVRKTFEFKLSAEFCLLDPMDLVTLTDPLLGLNGAVVRITEIEEAEDGSLSITAEEFSQGVGSSVAYPIQAKSNGAPNAAVAPAAINTPLIIEPPPALSGGTTQLWLGASGVAGDPNWGGCMVWASLDGTSYAQLAQITAPAKQGVLTASLATYGGSNPDTTDTLAVDLTQSAGTLQSTSSASAAAGVTLCYVDGEYLAYATATLTATSKYSLTGLYRGLDGIAASAHASGASFCLLDTAILKYDVPTAEIGQTIWLKFQSVNIFGGALEDISTCVAYTHTIQGTGVLGPVAAALAVGTAMDWGHVAGDAVGETDDFGMASSAAATFIDLGNVTS